MHLTAVDRPTALFAVVPLAKTDKAGGLQNLHGVKP